MNKLMRVQYMNLISKENDTAVVEVTGMSKSKPHNKTVLRGTFKKNSAGEWKLISIDS